MNVKQEYNEYFISMLSRLRRYGPFLYGHDPFYPQPIIDKLLENIPKSWRSDARYYMALTFITMVVLPYDEVDGRNGAFTVRSDVWKGIKKDLEKVIARAEEIARDRDRGYVSATSVAIAIGELAHSETLFSLSLQIWGPGIPEGQGK